jgi:hypothetical protein
VPVSIAAHKDHAKPKPPGETLCTYVSAFDAALLRARATAGGRSPSAEIRLALRAHLEDDRWPPTANRSGAP